MEGPSYPESSLFDLFPQVTSPESDILPEIDEKSFECSHCTKRFKIHRDLRRHFRIHTGARPFQCSFPDCDKSFSTTDIRKIHEKIHKNERDFKCAFAGCEKSFTNKRNLVNHENIHSQTKPYACKTCEKRFTEYSAWYKHARNVHPEPRDAKTRIHKCRFCQNSYKNRQILEKHVKEKHETD